MKLPVLLMVAAAAASVYPVATAFSTTTSFSSPALLSSLAARSGTTRRQSFCVDKGATPMTTTTTTTTTSLQQLKSSSVSSMGWEPSTSRASSRLLLQRLQHGWRRSVHSIRNNEVTQWRLVFGSILASLLVFRKPLDAQLVLLWDYLLHSNGLYARIFRTDSWEWCWAISCFVVWIHGFGLADRLVRQADQQGRIHPWKKYRLQDRYEADKQHRRMQRRRQQTTALVSKASTVVNKEQDEPDKEPPVAVVEQTPWNFKFWFQELPVYAVPLLIWDITAPRRHRRIGGFGAPTTLGILGGVVGGLFLYDFLFFLGHVAMHKIPILNRTIHAKHHTRAEVRACEIVRLGVAEEVLEVGFSIVALGLLSVHPVARTIYNAVITFLLTELHCGFDFPWTPQNVVPFGLATGSRRHHYHHRNGKHYYQKFFYHVDHLFNCYQKNDGSVQGDSVQPKPYIPPAWKAV